MTYREQRCATHPDRDGAVACTRCGSFACPECERAGLRGALCVTCHDKLSDLAKRARRARRSGSTFALVAVLALLSAGSLLLNLERGGTELVVVAAGLAAFAGVGFKTALEISRLSPLGRRLGLIVAATMLPLFPLGTLLGAEALITLGRHRDAFTPEARTAVETIAPATEEISPAARWIIGALVLGVAAYFVWVFVFAS